MKKDPNLTDGMAKLTIYVDARDIESITRDPGLTIYNDGRPMFVIPRNSATVRLIDGTIIPMVGKIEVNTRTELLETMARALKKEAKKP